MPAGDENKMADAGIFTFGAILGIKIYAFTISCFWYFFRPVGNIKYSVVPPEALRDTPYPTQFRSHTPQLVGAQRGFIRRNYGGL